MLAKLDTLHRATNLTNQREARCDAGSLCQGGGGCCGGHYQEVTGRKPTRVTNPDTNEARGPFHAFLTAVFAAAKVDGKPITHVQRLTAGRKARQKIAP